MLGIGAAWNEEDRWGWKLLFRRSPSRLRAAGGDDRICLQM